MEELQPSRSDTEIKAKISDRYLNTAIRDCLKPHFINAVKYLRHHNSLGLAADHEVKALVRGYFVEELVCLDQAISRMNPSVSDLYFTPYLAIRLEASLTANLLKEIHHQSRKNHLVSQTTLAAIIADWDSLRGKHLISIVTIPYFEWDLLCPNWYGIKEPELELIRNRALSFCQSLTHFQTA